MRFLNCGVLLLAACAGSESRTTTTAKLDSAGGAVPATTASSSTGAAKYTGTWSGRSFRAPKDTGVAWTNVLTLGADGMLHGSLTFAGAKGPAIPSRGPVADSGLTMEVGPYVSPTLKAEVTTTVHARVVGDSMSGTFESRPTKPGAVTHGTMIAKRTGPPTP